MTVHTAFVDATRQQFARYRMLAEQAEAQVDDAAFFRTLGDDGNSIALLVKHLAGNHRSRWRDFLVADGEKPDRHRDTEFALTDADTRTALLTRWAEAWTLVDDTLAGLAHDDLTREVTIRAEPMPAVAAVQRSLAHAASHCGQIVLLAKHWVGPDWQTLSIPRGGSDAFLAEMRARHGG